MTAPTFTGTLGTASANPDGSFSQAGIVTASDGKGNVSAPAAIQFQFPRIRPRPVLPTGLTIWNKGDLVLTTPGDVVQNIDVTNGRIVFKTNGAGVHNFIARGGKNPGYSTGLIDCSDANAVGCSYSHGLFLPNNPSVGWDAVIGHGITGDDFEIQGTIDGLGNFNTHGPGCNCRFTNGLVHNLIRIPDKAQPDGFSHSDGDQDQGEAGLYMRNMDITGITSALMLTPNVGPISGLDVQYCWLNSSPDPKISVAVVNFAGKGKPLVNIGTVANNRFGRGGEFPMIMNPNTTGNFEGNVYDDNGDPIVINRHGS